MRRWAWWAVAVAGLSAGCGFFAEEAPPEPPPAKGAKAGKARGKPAGVGMPEGPRAAREEGPNVLVLVWDTVRADRLSAYGYGLPTSPRLEALAAEGLLFERAVSPAMWTLPGHASLFTGLPESAHGATAKHKWLDARFPTLADGFYASGWDTYLFSANPYLEDHTNLGQGFATREFPWNPKWRKAAEAATMGKILPDDASNTLGPKWVEKAYPAGRSNDKVKDAGPVAAEALVSWIDGRTEPGRPWFAVLNYMEAHIPRLPSQASREALFDAATIREQLEVDQSYGYMLAATVERHDFDAVADRAISTVYDASLRDLDAATGLLLDKLKERGELDDTIVVVTADHGEHLGEHHRYDHKYSVYNPLVRVPLVIRYPKAIAPGRVAEVVSTLGLFATLSELTGVPLPEGTQSKSLLQPSPYGNEAYSELMAATPMALDRVAKVHPDLDREPWMRTYASVETADRKCIERSDGHRELYAMPGDALETKDLAADDPGAAATTCGRIATWRATFPAYDPKLGKGEGPGELSDDLKDRLEALGYAEGDEEPAQPRKRGKKAGGEEAQ